MTPPPEPLLRRLIELQAQVKRQRTPAADLKVIFEHTAADLEGLEAEAAAKLAARAGPPVVDTTSAALVQALQNAEDDGVHIEIVPTDTK